MPSPITHIQLKRNNLIYDSYKVLLNALKDKNAFITSNNFLDGELIIFRYLNDDKTEVRSVIGQCIIKDNLKDISLNVSNDAIDAINKRLDSFKPKKIIQVEKYVKAFSPLTNRHYEFTSSDIRNFFIEGQMVILNEKQQLTGVPLVLNLTGSRSSNIYKIYYNVSGLSAHPGNKVLRFVPYWCTSTEAMQFGDLKENLPLEGPNCTIEGKTYNKLGPADIQRVYLVPQGSRTEIEGKYLSGSKCYEFEISKSVSGTAYDLCFEFKDGDFKTSIGTSNDARVILSNFAMFNAFSGDYIDNYDYDMTYDSQLAFQRYYTYVKVYEDGSAEETAIPYDTSKLER